MPIPCPAGAGLGSGAAAGFVSAECRTGFSDATTEGGHLGPPLRWLENAGAAERRTGPSCRQGNLPADVIAKDGLEAGAFAGVVLIVDGARLVAQLEAEEGVL